MSIWMWAGVSGAAVAIFWLGWSARIMWAEWQDDRALRAMEARYERHSHRKAPRKLTREDLVAAHICSICGTSWDTPDNKCACSRAYSLERLAGPELAPLEPPWLFAGESSQGWAAESAEYELLTQTEDSMTVSFGDPPLDPCNRPECCGTTEQPVSITGEPPIDTGELLAITDRVEAWIAQWTAQGNIDRHTIQAGE